MKKSINDIGVTVSIEDKLKSAKDTNWLANGLSDWELKVIKYETSIYLIFAHIIISLKDFIKGRTNE